MLHAFLRRAPIPTAGLALGLVSLGNFLAPLSAVVQLVCAILATVGVVIITAKVIVCPGEMRRDFGSSVFASVFATYFMAIMQLTTILASVAYEAAFVIWVLAIVGHVALMVGFTATYIRHFELGQVFPTYFIAYVGLIVASVTAPTFGMQAAGEIIFWFGFVCYAILLVVVTIRYAKIATADPTKPLFAIYAAPMSLSLAGYLSSCAQIDTTFVIVLAVLAQVMTVLVITKLPLLLRLPFYPSYAAMTFPFVITAVALNKTIDYLALSGTLVGDIAGIVLAIEAALAIFMVCFVFVRYSIFYTAVVRESAKEVRERKGAVS